MACICPEQAETRQSQSRETVRSSILIIIVVNVAELVEKNRKSQSAYTKKPQKTRKDKMTVMMIIAVVIVDRYHAECVINSISSFLDMLLASRTSACFRVSYFVEASSRIAYKYPEIRGQQTIKKYFIIYWLEIKQQ